MAHITESTTRTALRRAAVRATLAPSVHNTQPWRFELHDDALDIYADPSRQLRALDPTRRQLTISCGCAAFNARVTLADAGFEPVVHRLPDLDRPDLLVRITVGGPTERSQNDLTPLDAMLDQRRTNRRRFAEDEVPADVILALEAAAALEQASLVALGDDTQRLTLARLAQQADNIQLVDPVYRAELRAWMSLDPMRLDGVSALAVPHVDGTAHDEIPMRDFDTHGLGVLPAATHSSKRQCLVLLCTAGDTVSSWLRAGEALERVWLEITRRGFVASPLTQVVEVPATRAALRRELGLSTFPHVVLRIGRAPGTPASRRRRLVDVLAERL